jgi:hypothetical protein
MANLAFTGRQQNRKEAAVGLIGECVRLSTHTVYAR